MNAERYHARVSAGLCAWSVGCRSKAAHGKFCTKHWRFAKKLQRRARRQDYMRRKLSGACTGLGCKAAPLEDSLVCAYHQQLQRAYNARPERLAARREATKASRAALVAKGVCGRCGNEPLESETMGERCLTEMRGRGRDARAKRAAAAGREPRLLKCRRCGRPGHRARTCEHERAELEPLRIEDFMSAPSALASEMAKDGGGGNGSGKWKRREAA